MNFDLAQELSLCFESLESFLIMKKMCLGMMFQSELLLFGNYSKMNGIVAV